MNAINLLGPVNRSFNDPCQRLWHTNYTCSWSNSLSWGSTLFTKEQNWSLPACLTWLHPCNSRGEKQEWRGSSVTHILFLTHNLLQNHTSLCSVCMCVLVYIHMGLCVTCLNTSKHRCVFYTRRSLSLYLSHLSMENFSSLSLWFLA